MSDEMLQVAERCRRAARSRCIGARGAREDLTGAAVAVGAFEDDASAAAFAAAARAAGVPVNVIDKPAFCDFSFGAIVNRSPLVIGISTDGAAPVFAQAIRAKLEALLPQGFAGWAAAAGRWRAQAEGDRAFVRRPAQVLAVVHRACGGQPEQRAGRSRLRCALSRRCGASAARSRTARSRWSAPAPAIRNC